MMLTERFKPVPVASELDLTGAAINKGDSINMSNFHSATFYVMFGALGTADCYVTAYSGATAAATTSALTFRYAFGSAATLSATADVLTAWSTSAALACAHATYDNYMLVVEIEASEMDVANGEEWLTICFEDIDTNGTGNVTCVGLLTPRYKENIAPTAIT
jgi:hypothetical protein